MIRVFIVDDQPIVREGLKLILSLYRDEIELLGEASNGVELLAFLADNEPPEVILMDIKMPVMDGIEATKRVKSMYPAVKIIILTTFNDNEYIFSGLKNGADGYILKDSGSEDIRNAVKTVRQGNILLNPAVTAKVVDAYLAAGEPRPASSQPKEDIPSLEMLTPRERDVAQRIMAGRSNKAIGQELFLMEGSVKNYVSRILEKLGLKSRSELIVFMYSQRDR